MSRGKLFLFTGFPGPLGSQLAKRLLADDPEVEILALVREKSQEHGKREIDRIEAAFPAFTGRISLISGDLVSPDLGLWRHLEELLPRVIQIFHLATTFKLKADPSFTHRINMVGTRNVVDMAGRCPNLERLQYLSTTHISGQYKGSFDEADFDLGQSFKNPYEETKFQAEREVRDSGLPFTIYRPSLMVGDSLTGEIPRYDGPVGIIQLLLHAPALLSHLATGKAEVNLVPTDFVAEAMAHLASRGDTVGQVFHLIDPTPPTAHQLTEMAREFLQIRSPGFPLPPKLVAGLLDLGAHHGLEGVSSQAIEYLCQEVKYTAPHTLEQLKDSGIRCPHVKEYLPNVLSYAKNAQGLQGAIA